jgi:pyruvate dehydrogenase E2 component (dihydrolipoamide acetyltransferase)
MATIIRMPEVAANATHATLVSWSKKEGDTIASGQSIADVETDKAVIELNVEASGTIARLLVKNGTEVLVGAPIAVLIENGETLDDADKLLQGDQPAFVSSSQSAQTQKPSSLEPPDSELTRAPEVASSSQDTQTHVTLKSEEIPHHAQINQRIFSSPVARLLIRQHGLDMGAMVGSGPNGRIVKYDVIKAIGTAQSLQTLEKSRVMGSTSSIHNPNKPMQESVMPGGYVDIPHTNMRRTIARRLLESKSTVPHFYLAVECRVDKLMSMRTEINAHTHHKISVNDFVVLAAARALRDVPQVNVNWTDEAIRQFNDVDISIAVSTETGLMTPILFNVNSKSLSQISQSVRSMAERAKQGQLRPAEFQGGTFSISNLGMYGIDEFAAIINPPQAAILAVGAVKARPVIGKNGVVEAGQVMRCTLSVDHRAVDGALAATWLSTFRRYIESPSLLVV